MNTIGNQRDHVARLPPRRARFAAHGVHAHWAPCLLFSALLGMGGCSAVVPDLFRDPEFRREAIAAFRESAKQWDCEGTLEQPGVAAYTKIEWGVYAPGVRGRARIVGSQAVTRPAGPLP